MSTHRVDLLPVYDQSNGWHEILEPLQEATTLTGDIEVDYLVIGGGYSGLAVARRLAELDPSATIALIDGDRIGNNAAGRSSGFAIDHAHNLRAKGFADAKKAAQDAIAMNRAGLDWLESTIARNNIDCQWVREGKYHAAATTRGERMLGQFAESLDSIDEDYHLVDADECAAVFGTSYYRRALHAPHSYLCQPAAMVRGLAATMPENVSVYEDSMVTSVDYGPPHTVHTNRGSAKAPVLVLATNGFTEGFGFLQKRLIPLITWGSMTRELTDEEAALIGGEPSYGIIAAHPAGTSVRRVTTPHNRILVRNIFSFSKRSDFIGRKRWAAKTHRTSFVNRWPELEHLPFEHSWGGALSLSRNGAPVFGELRPGVYGSVVHNGVGIARGTISGKLLAEMILGEGSELLQQMLVKDRPNQNLPFQDLGVRINARARRLIAGREE
ncbi:MAG: FAD-binding oxidoreductase [Acidimicrobiales bacterium]|nr:MAG: FAD-binding oxidoreductase [Acidimicrobiales bacterium]